MVPSALNGGPTTPSSESRLPSIVRATIEDPAVAAILVYALVAAAAAVAAYFVIFTVFAPYDDEGTLLVTLKAFTHGHTLYSEIYSPYGPFYYELFGGLFALTGHAVTTDASRTLVIVIWVATSLLFGLGAQRLTGRLAVGAAATIVAFSTLSVLAAEPMHPQVLCVLLLGLFLLGVGRAPGRGALGWGAAWGAVLAALVLTKVNLGLFAVAAVALAAVLTVEPLRRRRWLLWPVLAGFLAMPAVLTARDLGTGWVHELALIEMLSSAAVVVAAWELRPARDRGAELLSRWLVGSAVGFAVAVAAILIAIVATGATLADVYDGTIHQAIRVREVLVSPLPFPSAAVDWAVAALAVAVVVARFGPSGPKPRIWAAALRAAAGLTIWYTAARVAPLGLSPSAGNPDTLPLVLVWVAAVPPAGAVESAHKRFLRVLLPALAVAETLQVYPVAGSQMGIAALTFVPAGAICVGDALTSFREWSAERGPDTQRRFGAIATVAAVAIVVQLALDTIALPAADNIVAYRDQKALPLPGARLLHLPAGDVETYSRLVALLHEHHCTTFVGYPNIDSLYLWSEIEAPPPAAPGAWIKAVEADQQRLAVEAARASPRPCAIRSEARAELWLHGEPPPMRPLVRYIFDEFKPVETVGEFEFMLPKATIAKN